MSRQKILSIITASLVGLVVGNRMVRSLIIEPYKELDQDIVKKAQQVSGYQQTISMRVGCMENWLELGKHTLATEPDKAQVQFDAELKKLIDKHGLQKESTRPKAVKRRRNGSAIVPYSVQGEASLKAITEFLVDLYELPYTARVTTLRLRPSSAKTPEILVLSMDVETLVLPDSKLAGPIEPVDPEANDAPRHVRYALASAADYSKIHAGNYFQEYVPPPPPPPPPKERPKTNIDIKPKRQRDPAPPSPPPPPPPPNDNSRIVAIYGYAGQAEVVTAKPGRGAKRKTYLPGDEMGGGILRLVHPYGAVIRIGERDWVYPMGATLDKEEQRVPADEVPQIWRILEAADRPKAEPQTDQQDAGENTASAAASAEPAPQSDLHDGTAPAAPNASADSQEDAAEPDAVKVAGADNKG